MILAPSGITSSVVHCPRSRIAVRGRHIVYRVINLQGTPYLLLTWVNVDLLELSSYTWNQKIMRNNENTRGSLFFRIYLALLWHFWWMQGLVCRQWPTQRTIGASDKKSTNHCAHTSLLREGLDLHMRILTLTHAQWQISQSVHPHRW